MLSEGESSKSSKAQRDIQSDLDRLGITILGLEKGEHGGFFMALIDHSPRQLGNFIVYYWPERGNYYGYLDNDFYADWRTAILSQLRKRLPLSANVLRTTALITTLEQDIVEFPRQ